MGFKRFVEIGRVAVISYGPDSGKLCTIVDVIDHNRVLVDGPAAITGVHRHELGINRIMLTDLKVAAKHNASHKCAPAHQLTPRGDTGQGGARGGTRGRGASPGGATTAAAPPFRPRPAAVSPSLLPLAPAGSWRPCGSRRTSRQVGRDELGEKIQKRKLRASMTDFDRFRGDAGAQGARCAQGRVIAVICVHNTWGLRVYTAADTQSCGVLERGLTQDTTQPAPPCSTSFTSYPSAIAMSNASPSVLHRGIGLRAAPKPEGLADAARTWPLLAERRDRALEEGVVARRPRDHAAPASRGSTGSRSRPP